MTGSIAGDGERCPPVGHLVHLLLAAVLEDLRVGAAAVEAEYGVRAEADGLPQFGQRLGNWVRAYREKHAEEEPPLQVSERARLRELERRNRELEMELAFLKKAAAYFAREPR